MAMGIELMLKSMGFDPDAIKKQVLEFQENLTNTFKHFDLRLQAIESRLGAMEAQQNVMLNAMLLMQDSVSHLNSDVLPAGQGVATGGAPVPPKGKKHGGTN
jgi:hypothetical protein